MERSSNSSSKIYVILVQGAGGGGGNNLIRSIRSSSIPCKIIGTNCLKHAVAKSTADVTYLSPASDHDHYEDFLLNLIKKEAIDVIIPTSDREVNAVARISQKDGFPCFTFLPTSSIIDLCQDKHSLYKILSKNKIPVAKSVSIEEAGTLDKAFEQLPFSERYWIRPRQGSGSKGAGWVYNVDQAERFISLWEDLRGYHRSQYQVSTFLEGSDYAFQSIWHQGELIVAKLVERLSYFGGANRLSGMSSTPEIARTIHDPVAVETAIKAIQAISKTPHGVYSMDFKCDQDGIPHITEINIGRCCMITTIFDSTGVQNTVEAYIQCALGLPPTLENPIDIDEGWLLIRELDTEPLVVHESTLLKGNDQ